MIKDYFAPSKDQGEVIGVVIHNDWGLDRHSELQELILADDFEKRLESPIVSDLWNQLSNTYPELDALNLRNDSRYHIVLGCVSQFNYDDIKYFIKFDWRSRPKEIEDRADSLRERFGYGSFQWVPSEKTLDTIENALMAKAA